MRDLIGVTQNNLLNDIVDRTVREALKLQAEANKEWRKQEALRVAGQPYNFTVRHHMQEGANALCQVLWEIFGGCPADSMAAIKKIADENKSEILGSDCQDYVSLYMDAFELVRFRK